MNKIFLSTGDPRANLIKTAFTNFSRTAQLAIVILATLATSGCATIFGPSEDECRNTSWGQAGHADALEGKTLDESRAYWGEQCGEDHGISPKESEIAQGYQAGLKVFCTPEHGRKFGEQGKAYQAICPSDLEAKFIPAYQNGQIVYLQGEISSLKGQVSDLESKVSSLQSELSTCKSSGN